jgi:hypothetical protein
MTTTKNLNDYKIESFVYPEDLGSNLAYSENKVLFFINVAAGSKLVKKDVGENKYELWDVPESDQVNFVGKATAEAVVPESLAKTKMQRLSVAIALYVPNALVQGTTVGWDEEDLTSVAGEMLDSATKNTTLGDAGVAAGTVAALAAVGGLVGGKRGAVVGGVLGIGSGLVGSGSAGAGAEAGSAAALRASARAQRTLRQTPGNSKKELLFSSVNFRTFDFNYQFAPKSPKEAENVMNIIRMFKHHMLPEFTSETKSIYIYPSEFNVKYYKGNKENPYIEKQMTAILEGVNVDYTPNGQFNTFANGMPQQINLSLRFKELSTPSKETSPYDSHGV